jgi:hypothetical protein
MLTSLHDAAELCSLSYTTTSPTVTHYFAFAFAYALRKKILRGMFTVGVFFFKRVYDT